MSNTTTLDGVRVTASHSGCRDHDPPVNAAPDGAGRAGPCGACVLGDHYRCTGVGCYRCPRRYHRRRFDQLTASIGDQLPMLDDVKRPFDLGQVA